MYLTETWRKRKLYVVRKKSVDQRGRQAVRKTKASKAAQKTRGQPVHPGRKAIALRRISNSSSPPNSFHRRPPSSQPLKADAHPNPSYAQIAAVYAPFAHHPSQTSRLQSFPCPTPYTLFRPLLSQPPPSCTHHKSWLLPPLIHSRTFGHISCISHALPISCLLSTRSMLFTVFATTGESSGEHSGYVAERGKRGG